MNFKKYAELAKRKNNISSDNQLAKQLKISSGAINLFVNGKSNPSPDTFLKVATLAGIDEKQAVLDFFIDRYGKYEEVKKVLTDISKNLNN